METSWQWNIELETGVDEIDTQHKQLFEQVNLLMQSMAEHNKGIAIEQTLSFLKQYIQEHFTAEEKLQEQSKYPGLLSHKQSHLEFVYNFQNLIQKFTKDGITPDLSLELSQTVNLWLVEHIGMEDKNFADYLKNKE